MNKYLLIDFGASRIKSAIFEYNNKISDIKNFSAIKPSNVSDSKFEINLYELRNIFNKIISLYSKKYQIKGIFMCSEMHGFALVDSNNNPLSNYISWKDSRCLNKIKDINSYELLNQKLQSDFFKKTGMIPRACYPVFNVYDMIRKKEVQKAKIITLPEWLATCNNNSCNIAHSTMSAGLGFYNIYTKCIDKDILKTVCQEYNTKLLFNDITDEIAIAGYVNYDNKNIPIYTGIGDHQTAVLGAGNDYSSISVNLGTGSQVALINCKKSNLQKRPYFDGDILSAITHIPSGRAFLLIKEKFENFFNTNNFFEQLAMIKLSELESSTYNINLCLFDGAFNIETLEENYNFADNNFDKKNFFASILRCYCNQYIKTIEYIKPPKKYKKLVLSGGIPILLPIIKEYFNKNTDYDIISNEKIDETFLGLAKIANKTIEKFKEF